MYEILDKYAFIITVITSALLWYLATRLAFKEDDKYRFNKKEMIITGAIAIGGSIGINVMNPNVTLITLFLMTGIISVLSVSLMVDFKVQELPDCLTVVAWVLGVLFLLLVNTSNYLITIGIAVAVALLMFLICYFFGGIGFGDVKLIAPILFFVPPSYMMSYWLNTVIAALVVALVILVKTKDRKFRFAFGPYMIMGLLSVFLHLILI